MIDGETGERTIHTLVKSQDEVRERTQMWFPLLDPRAVNDSKLLIVELIYLFAVLHPWQRYIDRGIRTYTWAPVNGTDYR